MASYEKVIDNIRQLNELEELPNSIFTDDIVGVGADIYSPNKVQKMVSNQVEWHITCELSIDSQKYREPGREVDQRWFPVKIRRSSGEYPTSLYKPIATPVLFFCDEMGNK